MPEKPLVIFTHGYTASMKTYVARRIGNHLKIPLFETNKMGRCTNDDRTLNPKLRDIRYNATLALGRTALQKGISIIIDGSFSSREKRKELYHIAKENGVDNVIAMQCICNNEEIIRTRLQDRSLDDIRPENEVTEFDIYLKVKAQCEEAPIQKDSFPTMDPPALITFDSGKYTIHLETENKYNDAMKIRDLIWRDVHTGRLREH